MTDPLTSDALLPTVDLSPEQETRAQILIRSMLHDPEVHHAVKAHYAARELIHLRDRVRELEAKQVLTGSPMSLTHWTKDPLVPYAGCGCSTCQDARRYVTTVTTGSDAP